MDQTSSSADPRERAVSSEPCATRPNPFDDSELSSRKRRRTSLTTGSRSRSVESPASLGDLPTSSDHDASQDSAMKLDTDASEPQQPQTPSQPPDSSEPPASEPVSSRVTLNLRNTGRPPEAAVSSPVSPSPATNEQSDSVPDEDIKTSVEVQLPEAEPIGVPSFPNDDSSRASSPEDTASPPIEVVAIQSEEDSDFESDKPQVLIINDLEGATAEDPTARFPYHDLTETYPETVTKLTQYMGNVEVVSSLNDWIKSYLEYRKLADYSVAFESYQESRDLWHMVPELLWVIINRKVIVGRVRGLRQELSRFLHWFAQLAASFVELDLRTLRFAMSVEDTSYPDLASHNYIHALAFLTRREDFNAHTAHLQNGDASWNHASEVSEVLDTFQTYLPNQGGTLAYLCKLAQAEVELMSRFPKTIDSFGVISLLVCNILRENCRKVQNSSSYAPDAVNMARGFFHRGFAFFTTMSEALASAVNKQVTHLSHECASQLITSLTAIYQLCLYTDRSDAVMTVIKSHRQQFPEITPQHVPEAESQKWRLSVYSRLITSSQMQLRVMAVTSMATDLVHIWKRFSESYDETNPAMLGYLANFILQTGLISYILGPTCHPEITMEAGNIIGFLLVTKTYTNKHTDIFWQTITSSKDPRVSDALLRMVGRIANLYPYEGLIYICEKLNTLPPEAFGPNIRDFCDQIFRHLPNKLTYDQSLVDAPPFALCVRLIKESSISGHSSTVAFPELQSFAIQKLRELLAHGNPDREGRHNIYLDCLKDIGDKSPSALGSLWTISIMLRSQFARELQVLTVDFDFARLLVDELEAALDASRTAGSQPVIHGGLNSPRKELILGVVTHQPGALTEDLGLRLWNMLVGTSSCCREDRDAAWQILNTPLKRPRTENPYIATCFNEYLPNLPPEYYCDGTLEFVRDYVLPLVNDPASIILDDEDSSDKGAMEQLWRMVLTAPENSIEQKAIHTLVNDVYVDSRSITAFSHHRARKVHLSLVDRCLSQLSSASAKLKAFCEGTASGDDESMVIVPTDGQVMEQELLFIRSLSVLREFHRLHQAKSQFAAPDFRSFTLETPNAIEGDSAELKYQCFDGDVQTDVKPLNIGKRNTAASLLASLRDATGFDNYRIYYRGKAFIPQESDICKSLEDLQIQNGIILVKREADAAASSVRIRPGASPIEIEIMGHFNELWDYLSLEEKLGREIYHFLVKLPVDDKVAEVLQTDSATYELVFPVGQPFKALYAVNAFREYLAIQRRNATVAQLLDNKDASQAAYNAYANTLATALKLVVDALSDREVIRGCGSQELQVQLGTELVESFVHILNDPLLPESALACLSFDLLDHLISMLSSATLIGSLELATKPIYLSFQAVLDGCAKNRGFWGAFCQHPEVPGLVRALLLDDVRPAVRKHASKLIVDKINVTQSPAAVSSFEFRDFFWPLAASLIPIAARQGGYSEEVFQLCFSLYKPLRASGAAVLDVEALLHECCDLLHNYTTHEDVTQPDVVDIAALGLTRLIHSIVCWEDYPVDRDLLPPVGFARALFWRHLFPPFDKAEFSEQLRPILHPETRSMLVDIVFALVSDDQAQLMWLLEDLDALVPFHGEEEEDEGDPYAYELPAQFERAKAIRSSCGYVGMKNLSNTCYFNSLFTQLFMNIGFRTFMLGARVRDSEYSQSLLFQTQKLFSFLQNSIRRFVNPEECVGTIKTYEDTQIDVHNQMDVDEFYNLLFDRWESQLLSAEAKMRFRSFYGGQLVQQVNSKECDHVSEKLEPFSAIQCDIKGKSSLQESLQAYVDGEMMEGENKYKCSTCDRHVDAVKRACLKDIPDNLIFHLKRFDFNLRAQQRSKINDYFSFPNRIDMGPYTIAHLGSPTRASAEDIFELVGVLVHSGTAESGHYYSYIRERPTTSPSEVWIEFNDDTVTQWDPSHMDSSCFGGADYRGPFDSNGVAYDKTYSAYMLFYQRATSLRGQQEVLSGTAGRSPFHVELPPELSRHIEMENVSLLRRHCLYDPSHINNMVTGAMRRMKAHNDGNCSADHAMETVALKMALSHLDQVASRAKDIPDFETLYGRIDQMGQQCVHCAVAIYEYFNQRHMPLRMLVQRNVEATVRQDSADLVIRAIQVIKQHLPEQYGNLPEDEDDEVDLDSTIYGVARMFRTLWETFHVNLRSWPEVFGFMLSFVRMGRLEVTVFLEQDFLRKLLQLISADTSLDLPGQYHRMITTIQRRSATRPVSYEAVISLVAILLSTIRHQAAQRADAEVIEYPEDRHLVQEGGFVLSRAEYKLVHQDWNRGGSNIFVEKLISIDQNPEATLEIVANLLQMTRQMDSKIFATLKNAITGQISSHHNAPFLRAASVFCRFSARKDMIESLIRHICIHCMGLQNAEGKAFLEFQRDVFDGPRERSRESPEEVKIQGLQFLPEWTPGLLGYFDEQVSSEVEAFLQEKLFQYGPNADFGEPAVANEDRASAMDDAARAIGINCLVFLRDNYVSRRLSIGTRYVVGLQRVIAKCERYFEFEDENRDKTGEEFLELKQEVLEPLRRLTVEDILEEDASDWENSSVGSEQVDSLGDISMQAGADVNETDVQ